LSYANERKWARALEVLQQALAVDPRSAGSYQLLADVYAAQNRVDDVVAAYQQGLTAVPDSLPLAMGLARYYEKIHDPDGAIRTYNEILQKNPADDHAANNLASVLADYRSDAKSIERARKLAERFADSPNPYQLDTYGWVTLKAGQSQQALAALKRVVAAAPDIAVFRYHLAMAYYQSDDHSAAGRELAKALGLAQKQGPFVGADKARALARELGDGATANVPVREQTQH